jgi:hypothetical protein
VAVFSYLVAMPRKPLSRLKQRSIILRRRKGLPVESWWSAAVAAAVVSVPSLVGLLGDDVRNAALTQVGAGAVGLVCNDPVGLAARSAQADAGDADPFQQRAGADAVVTLARCQEDGERASIAVTGEMNFSG